MINISQGRCRVLGLVLGLSLTFPVSAETNVLRRENPIFLVYTTPVRSRLSNAPNFSAIWVTHTLGCRSIKLGAEVAQNGLKKPKVTPIARRLL